MRQSQTCPAARVWSRSGPRAAALDRRGPFFHYGFPSSSPLYFPGCASLVCLGTSKCTRAKHLFDSLCYFFLRPQWCFARFPPLERYPGKDAPLAAVTKAAVKPRRSGWRYKAFSSFFPLRSTSQHVLKSASRSRKARPRATSPATTTGQNSISKARVGLLAMR
jgi:hypothetical protein